MPLLQVQVGVCPSSSIQFHVLRELKNLFCTTVPGNLQSPTAGVAFFKLLYTLLSLCTIEMSMNKAIRKALR